MFVLDGWVELELLGHRTMRGLLTVDVISHADQSPVLFRLDVPATDSGPAETHFYTQHAIYGIHPTTEAKVLKALLPPAPWCPTPPCSQLAGHEGECDNLADLPF